jgi:CheY-like chemotaxis protein
MRKLPGPFFPPDTLYFPVNLPMSSRTTVLIIDDNETDGWIAGRIIKKYDQQVDIVVFNHAADALHYLRGEVDPSGETTYVILLDIYMPGMDGWQFLEEYLYLSESTRAITRLYMHTSSISPSDQRRAGAFSYVQHYVSKPLVGGDLKLLQPERSA